MTSRVSFDLTGGISMSSPTTGVPSSRPEHSSFQTIAPPLLSFTAGYVDSCSYIGLLGLFTAQVTGSFVVAGAQMVLKDEAVLGKLLAIPVFFLGSALVAVLVSWAKQQGRSALPWALLLDFGCIGGFLVLGLLASPVRDPDAPLALIAGMLATAGMGVQSAMVRLLFTTPGSTNVMTTNTTIIAVEAADLVLAALRLQRNRGDIAAAERVQAARRRLHAMVPVLIGFLAGAAMGAIAFAALGFWCVFVAAALLFAIAMWALLLTVR
jgi:uncharacterized membrane protein YoaK (UPF0700 family)